MAKDRAEEKPQNHMILSESLCSELASVTSTHIPLFKIIHTATPRINGGRDDTTDIRPPPGGIAEII